MTIQRQVIEVENIADLDELVAAMNQCAASRRGWINVQCEVDDDAIRPQPSLIEQLLRKNAPDAALGTWTPPESSEKPACQHIGVQHHVGARILPELDQWGIVRPDGWRRIQDSPRRGLILAIPGATAHTDVIAWLLNLVAAASRVSTTGRWIATVHQGRST